MFFPGFLFGYLMYGTMHYAIHAWNPPFKWMKPLWRNHHLHHYKNEHNGFGVSSTFWDHVFGTMFDLKKEKEDKEKVKELMFEKSSKNLTHRKHIPVGPVYFISHSPGSFMQGHHLGVIITYPSQFYFFNGIPWQYFLLEATDQA